MTAPNKNVVASRTGAENRKKRISWEVDQHVCNYTNAENCSSVPYQRWDDSESFTPECDSAPARPVKENLDRKFLNVFENRNDQNIIR